MSVKILADDLPSHLRRAVNASDPSEVSDRISSYRRLLANDHLWEWASERPCRFSRPDQYQGATNGMKTDLFGIVLKTSFLTEGHFYIYKNKFCHVSGPYSLEEEEELVRRCCGYSTAERQRTVIPQAVRHEIWRRDQGQCVECGSKENLEYDHLIPFSKGGSNTVRNLRLLCEKCNRVKSDSI